MAKKQKRKPTKIHYVDCLCGTSFVSTYKGARYCLKCRSRKPYEDVHELAGRCRFFGDKRKPDQLLVVSSPRDYAERLARFGIVPEHTPEQWHDLLRFQNYRCYYCRIDLTFYTWSRDHKIPISRGGSDGIENIVACCRRCNSKKGTATDIEFINKLPRSKKEGIVAEPFFSQKVTTPSLLLVKSETYEVRERRKTVEREIAQFEAQRNYHW